MSELIYLGHASFLIKGKEYQIVIDPYENGSVPNLKFPKVEPVDAAIASHSHADHSAYHLVPIKDNPNRVSAKMLRVPHDHENGAKRGMNLIHIFDVDGYKVVHMGDIGCVLDERVLEPIKNADVLLAPINGFYTINPKELKTIVDMVKPRIVVPMHYHMMEYNSGYPDGNMIEEFKKLFPDYQYLDEEELDLNKYKDYTGALIFKQYKQ
jgi:L-ascorbate metabolism protein UlaG (beta-lactamase superfamily)